MGVVIREVFPAGGYRAKQFFLPKEMTALSSLHFKLLDQSPITHPRRRAWGWLGDIYVQYRIIPGCIVPVLPIANIAVASID